MPKGIHTVDLAHSSLVIHRVLMPFGIPQRPAPTIGVVRFSTKTLHPADVKLLAYLLTI